MDSDFETPDWHTDAGRLLELLARSLPAAPRRRMTVRGSAPLQLFIDAGFASNDIDIIGDSELAEIARGVTLPSGAGDICIQVSDPLCDMGTHSSFHMRGIFS